VWPITGQVLLVPLQLSPFNEASASSRARATSTLVAFNSNPVITVIAIAAFLQHCSTRRSNGFFSWLRRDPPSSLLMNGLLFLSRDIRGSMSIPMSCHMCHSVDSYECNTISTN
jgi:hypothetical protein